MFERAIELDADVRSRVGRPRDRARHALRVVRREGGRPGAGRNAPVSERWSWRPDLAEAHVARGFVLSLSRRYERGGAANSKTPSASIRNLFDAYYYFARTELRTRATSRARPSSFRQARRTSARRTSKARCCRRSRCACSAHDDEAHGRQTRRASGGPSSILVLNPLDGRALSLGSVRALRGWSDGARASSGRNDRSSSIRTT